MIVFLYSGLKAELLRILPGPAPKVIVKAFGSNDETELDSDMIVGFETVIGGVQLGLIWDDYPHKTNITLINHEACPVD